MDALVLVVSRTDSMAVRHMAMGACAALRAASVSGVERGLGGCLRAGQAAVGEVIRAFVERAAYASDLNARCIAEAVGSVVVHRVRAPDVAHWGSFGHFGHVCTLVVAGAVNSDEWRVGLIARNRERDRVLVYHKIIGAVDAWAARLPAS
jgi:hypothetical protein